MKKNKGNTLTFVLVVLIVVSILSMAIVYAVAYSSNAKLKKSNENFKLVTLENEAYNALNYYLEVVDDNKIQKVIEAKPFSEEIKEKLEINTIDNGKLNFMIRFINEKEGFYVEFEIQDNKYIIKKWGMKEWMK